MKIKRLRVVGWRAFPHEEIIEFSTNDKKPITLIHCENEFGKSSLTAAMRFAMHGEVPEDIDKDTLIDNQFLEFDQEKKATIELIIQSDIENDEYGKDCDYQIIRTISKNGEQELTVQRDEGGGFIEIDRPPQNFLRDLMPNHLGSIFFFTGESLKNSFFEKKDEDFRDILLSVSGLKSSDITKMHLTRYIEQQKQIKQKLQVKDKSNKEKKKELVEIDKLIKKEEENKSSLENIAKSARKSIDEINVKLGKHSADDVKKAADSIKSNSRQIKENSSEINSLTNKLNNLIQQHGFHVFTNGLIIPEIKQKKVKKTPYTLDITPTKANNLFLENIFEANECICGRKVNHDEKCIANINRFYHEGDNQGRLIEWHRDIKLAIDNYKNEPNQFIQNKKEIENNIKKNEKNIATYNENIRTAQEIIGAANEVAIKKLGDELKGFMRQEKDALEELNGYGSIKGSSQKLREYKDKKAKILKAIPNVDDEQIKEIDEKISFVEKNINFINFERSRIEKKTKDEVSNYLNELCEKYSKVGTRFSFLENSYVPSFLSEGEKIEPQPSTGKAAMKSIFFGSTMVRIASLSRSEENKLLDSGCIAPWVCDAPFASLDEANISSMAKVILDHEGQLIVFANAFQYRVGFRSELDASGKLGKQYIIKRNIVGKPPKEVSTKVKINNKDVNTIEKSDKKYPYSTIKRI